MYLPVHQKRKRGSRRSRRSVRLAERVRRAPTQPAGTVSVPAALAQNRIYSPSRRVDVFCLITFHTECPVCSLAGGLDIYWKGNW